MRKFIFLSWAKLNIIMKSFSKNFLPVVITFVLALSIYSCSEDNNPIIPSTQRCDRNLAFERNSIPADSFFVIYNLNISGNVNINSYRYMTPAGPVDVTNPTSPHSFIDTFFFPLGDTVFLNYQTEVTNGSVVGSARVMKPGFSSTKNDSCSYFSN